jgi:6-phosphogluconolactonase
VLWVFAAGNGCRDGQYESGPTLAGSFPQNVLAVASIGRTGSLSSFSNFGSLVSVAAPGEDILSTIPRSCLFNLEILCNPLINIYGYRSGTSPAAPFVSGLAALVLSEHPTFLAAQLKQCIVAASQQFGSPVSGQAFSVISAPESVACSSPFGKFAFVANASGSSDNVWSYSVDPTTGTLTPVTNPLTGSPGFTSSGSPGSFSVATDPAGKFVYVANLGVYPLHGDISAYSVNQANGVLTPVAGVPFSAGFGPSFIVLDPKARFAYVTNVISGDISAYTIDSGTGALSNILGSPFPFSVQSLAVEPAGRFLYGTRAGGVEAFEINPSTGGLTRVPGSPFPGDTQSHSVTVDPTGKFVYVANLSNSVSAYAIDSTTGALNSIAGSPFPGVPGTYSVTVDPSGKFLYVANATFINGSVSAYTINPTTGGLTQVVGSPFLSACGGTSVIVDSAGKFVYVANQCGAKISGFSLNPVNGALTPLVGSPFPAGSEPLSIALTGKTP